MARHHARGESNGVRLGVIVGMALVMAGAWIILRHDASTRAYTKLAAEVVTGTVSPDTGLAPHDGIPANRDWEKLRSVNGDVAAWVRVDGTDIDLPVLSPHDGDMGFCLSHDIWGEPSLEGVPFLDHRCDADGIHRLAYGHHLSMGGQFSDLQKAYLQEAFSSIGTCHWSTPSDGETALQPLCAMREDQWFEGIQRFTFEDQAALGAWLLDLATGSTARSTSWKEMAASAVSVVTLSTCSSDLVGQRWRTLVVFVEAQGT